MFNKETMHYFRKCITKIKKVPLFSKCLTKKSTLFQQMLKKKETKLYLFFNKCLIEKNVSFLDKSLTRNHISFQQMFNKNKNKRTYKKVPLFRKCLTRQPYLFFSKCLTDMIKRKRILITKLLTLLLPNKTQNLEHTNNFIIHTSVAVVFFF